MCCVLLNATFAIPWKISGSFFGGAFVKGVPFIALAVDNAGRPCEARRRGRAK